jgi:hypothetical protein
VVGLRALGAAMVAGTGDVALTFGGGACRKVELRLARAER